MDCETPETEIVAMLGERYGLHARVVRISCERDEWFEVRLPDGAEIERNARWRPVLAGLDHFDRVMRRQLGRLLTRIIHADLNPHHILMERTGTAEPPDPRSGVEAGRPDARRGCADQHLPIPASTS